MNSWTTLQSQLKQQKAIDTFWSNSMVTWNYIQRTHVTEVILSLGITPKNVCIALHYKPSLTCLISQLTFHCFMLANLHVVTGRPEDMSIRIIRLYEIPRISSFLPPLNLKTQIKWWTSQIISHKLYLDVQITRCVVFILNVWTVPDDVVVDTKLWKRLPGLDKAHLGLH